MCSTYHFLPILELGPVVPTPVTQHLARGKEAGRKVESKGVMDKKKIVNRAITSFPFLLIFFGPNSIASFLN